MLVRIIKIAAEKQKKEDPNSFSEIAPLLAEFLAKRKIRADIYDFKRSVKE